MPYVEYDEVEAICPECGMMFRSEETLDNHRETVHLPAQDSAPPTLKSKGSNTCSICHKKFGSGDALARHTGSAHRS